MAITIDSFPVSNSINHRLNALTLELSTDQYGMQENLSAYVKFIDVTNGGSPVDIATLNPHFNTDGTVSVNLANLIEWTHPLPASFAGFSKFVGVITGKVIKKYKAEVAEQYGMPVVVQATSDTDEVFVVNGFISRFIPTLHSVDHAYILKRPYNFVKPMHPGQQDWIYFYQTNAEEDVTIKIIATYRDGSTQEETELVPNQNTNVVTVGPKNLELAWGYDLTDMVSYQVLFNDVLVQEYYLTDPCHPYDMQILVDNGRGGLESAYLRGKKEHMTEVSKSLVKLYSPGDVDPQRGEYADLVREEMTKIKCHTGWHSQEYISHLKSIIARSIWWIREDLPLDPLIKITTRNTSVTFKKDEDDLYGFEIEFEVAYNEYPDF